MEPEESRYDESDESDENCIFCLIANGRDEEAVVIKQSKELVCFQDICPAAPHHYLVVPKSHIVSCESLHQGHIRMISSMVEMGKAVLQDVGFTDMTDIRIGFHKPPYISVNHLHLHVLAPASRIFSDMEYKFIPETESFVNACRLQKDLQSTSSAVDCFLRGCWGIQSRNPS